ncbi:MAG TPA: HEAT repeat domain-containing protein [Kofleriaceae bacterium]|nr:HEAT repeat domain-containing protein [Kofleriaceae bacterium]
MSDDTKGRTMIGTGTTPPGPSTAPSAASSAAPSAPPSAPPNAPTIAITGASPASASTPTVGMRPHAAPGGDPHDPEALVGQELCGYLVRRKLAEGGMGVVYEGEHTKIGRRGAIKVLKPELCRANDVVERFYQEARAVNAIHHENIVDIYDFGRDAFGRVCFVMEYLEGEPLSGRIARGALTWSEAFPILDQTIRALKAAHDKGFVHRDLKPDNIWLRDVGGKLEVKLLDFGIAKLVGGDSPQDRLTRTGSVIGTPHYMSPEQINGARDIDQRTDIYALGVIMYELFAGVTPFVGDTLQAIMTGHLFKEPPRLPEIPTSLGVPAPIAEVIDRMLVKDPAARYASVADVLGDLYDLHDHRPPTKADTLNRERPTRTLPAGSPELSKSVTTRPPRKRGAWIALALVGAAAVAGGAVWATHAPKAVVTKVTPPPITPPPVHDDPPPAPPAPPPYDVLRTEAQNTLHSSLRQEAPAVRVQGADAVGEVKDHPSLATLGELTERDADAEVRGHAALAIGVIGGAEPPRGLLARLERTAEPPLKVWYAAALARLGDPAARKRLATYARARDINQVAFPAGLELADVSRPGDSATTKILGELAAHEPEIDHDKVPNPGVILLGRAAALHQRAAREALYGLLHDSDQAVQLAAATELAKLGDDAGKAILQDVVAHGAPANRLLAALGQIPLGEYGGGDVLLTSLDNKDLPAARARAAQGLGATGELGETRTLSALYNRSRQERDWTVRIAIAGAILQLVGLDPIVLARASVDWTRSALSSPDLALRKAAAGVLADIPTKHAVRLLAAAIADKSPEVRLVASTSAGKIKTAEAAATVVAAVKTEKDPAVLEQEIKALGEIGAVGAAASHDTLAMFAEKTNRLGVLAAGSLIAIGDPAGEAKLEKAAIAPLGEIRLVAMQAAMLASNPIVIPTFKIGIVDKLFAVRFAAAEGLAAYIDQKPTAVPVLQDAAMTTKDKDPGVFGRALAALTRLGAPRPADQPSPADLIDQQDARRRLAAIPIVRVMPPAEGLPLLRRLIADQDPEVRHASVDAIADVVSKDKDQAIKLYRPLVHDADPVVRSKAAGQLARIAPPEPPPPPGSPVKTADAPVLEELRHVTAARDAADAASRDFEATAKDLTAAMAATRHDDATLNKVRDLRDRAGELATAFAAATRDAASAVQAAADAADRGKIADATRGQLDEATQLTERLQDAAAAARPRADELTQKANLYLNGDLLILITRAKSDLSSGNLKAAQKTLDAVKRRAGKTPLPELDDAYGELFVKLAQGAAAPAEQRKQYELAQAAYQRVVDTGAGDLAQRATAALAEIAENLRAVAP